ncbi:MAG: glutamate-5-semialdehyde dehydrogenase [Bacteroidia bacterium]|nr:glutamate-5-semialdehyde dehydrogenase [Bacteroidia bacterium]
MHTLRELLQAAQAAAPAIQRCSDEARRDLLLLLAARLEDAIPALLAANAADLARMRADDPKRDRLLLDEGRIRSLAAAVRDVAALPDPTRRLLYETRPANGLLVQKFTVPLGVAGIIYEARPNVTIDVAALCLRAGNAAVLRGGSDAWDSNQALCACIREALDAAGLPPAAVQLLPPEREWVLPFLQSREYLDVIIPRGSQELIDFVRSHATVPVIETGAGVCHTYVEASADLDQAAAIVLNAKVSRPSVCNALDTVLVDAPAAQGLLERLAPRLAHYGVRIFADPQAYAILHALGYPDLREAQPADFGREFLSLQCSVKVTGGFEEALDHIRRYSSKHSEAIVSQDPAACARFQEEVDAAAVYANASTRFTDGGVFGLGAEIGISTQKLHARGPFALEKLVTEKWVVTGSGQVRW